MAEDGRRARLRLLHEGVRVLALEADEQLSWIGDGHVDELGLVFDDGYRVVPTLRDVDGVTFEPQAMAVFEEIDRSLRAMSGERNTAVWTAAALRTDPRWHRLRALARSVAAELPPR